jgi:hypothetical protein
MLLRPTAKEMHAIAPDSKERRKKYAKSAAAKTFDRLGHALPAPMKC